LDTGLAVFLAGFRSEEDLFKSSLAGAIWESHVFGQILRQTGSKGESATINYWRTANGPEVDLVIEEGGGRVVAIECKLKERPDIADSAGLRALDEAEKGRIKKKFVVCRTKVTYKLSDGTWVVNLSELLRTLKVR
jgi:predicted AAA+ superfamily ATPase